MVIIINNNNHRTIHKTCTRIMRRAMQIKISINYSATTRNDLQNLDISLQRYLLYIYV